MTGAPRALVVMGVAGAGKTTLAEALAARLGWAFKDGDELHPAANVAKMSSGQPLNDADRAPWLAAVGAWIDARAAASAACVISCSALKRAYRDRLAARRPQVRFVYIDVAEAVIAERLTHRQGHFWPPGLLASQYAALEPPADDEPAIRVDGRAPTAVQVEAVIGTLGQGPDIAVT
jgi:carbohydrate kinase (thermoresistant glucokinase family)